MKAKKLIASLSAVALVMTSMVSISALADADYTDYVPGDKPANMIDASDRYGVTNTIVRHADMEYKYWETDDELSGNKFRVKYYYEGTDAALTLSEKWRGVAGFWMNRDSGSGGKSFGFAPQAGETYVFSANVKNASTEGVTPSFNIAMNDTYGPANILWPNEYGSEGMVLTDSYQKYNTTITFPEGYNCEQAFGNSIAVGLKEGAPVGSAFYIDVSSADAIYIAKEAAYDIAVSADASVVKTGESFKATSKITDQIGLVGALDQTCTWTILDSSKAAVTDGFTVSTNGAVATISVADTVAPGTYYAYAASGYDMGKSVAFTVKKASSYKDYVAGDKPADLIPNSVSSWQYFGARNSESDNGSFYNSDEGFLTFDYYYPADSSVTADLTPSDGWRAFSGFWLNQGPSGYDGSLPDFAPADGETYVLSLRVKDVSTNGVSPYVGLQMNNSWSPAKIVTTNEYGKTGMKVESDWTDFNASITLPDNYMTSAVNGDYAKKLIFGFVTGTKVGSRIRIDASKTDSVYFAKEVAYDITCKADNTTIKAGETANVSAEVVNQIGIEGALDQNIEFLAMDTDRENEIDGITITPANDGTAKVSVDASVAPGEYDIVAYSDEYGMAKGVTITVEAANTDPTYTLVDFGNITKNDTNAGIFYTLTVSKVDQALTLGVADKEFTITNLGSFDVATSLTYALLGDVETAPTAITVKSGETTYEKK